MMRRSPAPASRPSRVLGGRFVHTGSVPNVSWKSTRNNYRQPGLSEKAESAFPHAMGVDVIVTLCTHELLFELREWLPSARVCYPDATLVVYTDVDPAEVLNFAEELHVSDVYPIMFNRQEAISKSENIPLYSTHWKPETIWGKLDITRQTVADYPGKGVLFADSDITFAGAIERKYEADVVLSHAYTGDLQKTTPLLSDRSKRIPLFHRDGLFNAGMWLTRSLPFMEWWVAALEMAAGDDFLEQTSLENAPRLFVTDYMDSRENFGKWRFQAPPSDVNSYHFHLRERSRRIENTAIKCGAQKAAAKARAILSRHTHLGS